MSPGFAQPGYDDYMNPMPTPKTKKQKKEKPQPPIDPIPKELQDKQPPSMKITRELLTPAEAKKLEEELKKARYKKVFSNAQLAGGGARLLKTWGRARILAMSLKENRGKLYEMRKSVVTDIRGSAKINLVGQAASDTFRKALCAEVTACCEKLMDNNFAVRLNAVLLLGQMNYREFIVPRTLPVAYAPAADVLVEKVMNQKQPEAVRVAAVNSLKRIALLGDLSQKQKRDIARTLIKEFNAGGQHPWYQGRLLEAMAAVDLPADAGKPIIVDTLARAMGDPARPPQVRCDAAMALGRASLHANIKQKVLAHQIMKLTRDMAMQYNKDLNAVAAKQLNAFPSHWPGSFFKLYLAFVPRNRLEKEFLYQRRAAPADRTVGLAKRFQRDAAIQAAYSQVKVPAKHVIGNMQDKRFAPIPGAAIASMKAWIDKNKPADPRVHPSMPPLTPVKPGAVAGKTGATRNTSAGP